MTYHAKCASCGWRGLSEQNEEFARADLHMHSSMVHGGKLNPADWLIVEEDE